MNYGIVFRLLGAIVFALALAFMICFGVGLIYPAHPEESTARAGFLVCAALTAALSAGLSWLGRGASPRLFRKEALAVIGLGWLLASIIGAVPYAIIDARATFIDGFFESASGFTTTGASAFADVESMPRSLLFWRALSQWIGGMGVVVFFVAILGMLGAGAKILYSNEASGSTAEFDEPRVQAAVIKLWVIYLVLSGACAAVYILGGMTVYEGLCHMFATVSTGGFSTSNVSFVSFHSPFLEWSAIVFMILGGSSFVLLARALRGQTRPLRSNTEWHAYLAILGASSAAIAPFLVTTGSLSDWHDALRTALFQVTSIMTTSGFASTDFNLWPAFPKLVLLVLMIVGGCSASTAGGIKVARLVVAWRVVRRSVETEFRPHVVRRIKMNNQPVEEAAINEVLVFLVAIGVLCMVAVPLVAVFEPTLSLQAALSAVFASLFNVGPGFAEVGPMSSYADLHAYTKVGFALLMIMGRLELYAILVLCLPTFWRRAE